MRLLLPLALTATLLLPSAAAARTPRLTVSNDSPLTIKGIGFAAGERVRVVVMHDGATNRWATTSRLGSFSVRLPLTVDSCTAYLVRAFGARGDAATLAVRPPECPQPLTP
jgi:hypothetical protein